MAKKIDYGESNDLDEETEWADEDGDRLTIEPWRHPGRAGALSVNSQTVWLSKKRIRGVIAKLQAILDQ